MSSESTGESATGAVQELFLTFVTREGHDLIAVE
jgi:hypothetical protein